MFDARRNNRDNAKMETKEEIDSRRGTGLKENEEKKMEGVGIAKRYMGGNCEGGQAHKNKIE